MKQMFILLATLACTGQLFSQFNAALVGNLDYADGVNDVWGYVAPDSTEYAIVGLETGVSVVSLADPANPVEVGRITGTLSPWRDMKTYREYAYVVADRGFDGILVIDLSELPERISATNYTDNLPGDGPNLDRAHNIYIDTARGLAMTAGGDRSRNDGGMHIFDLKVDPVQPPLVARGPEIYSHDVFVRDSLMFASEIYRGDMAIYNIANLDSIFEVGRVATPFEFTHNAWSTADNSYVFTTDERGNASVAAYDISSPADIRLLDEYRPVTSLNTGSIPHNVHVIGDYLSISSYSDGLRVVDAADPTNLIEVAVYDTYDGPDGGFNGAWGAYPYLPSGLTLVSDRSSGLFVIDVEYVPASRIVGTVRQSGTEEPLPAAEVRILADQPNRVTTDARGAFQTGRAGGGTVRVLASALGYYDDTVSVFLTAGEEVIQDFVLEARPTYTIQLDVRDRESDLAVPGVNVNLYSTAIDYAALPDSNGTTELADVFDYDYSVLVTKWGYQAVVLPGVNGDELDGSVVYLDRGFQDIFSTDLGWTVSGDAIRGQWERGTPTATFNRDGPGQPGTDAPSDFGNSAYVTDLQGGNSNSRDVDRGETILTSPVMDLSNYGPGTRLEYSYWFSNLSGARVPDDSLTISLSNRDTTVALAVYSESSPEWRRDTILLSDRIALTDSMQLVVLTADRQATDNLVESVFDDFRILDSAMLSPLVAPAQNRLRLELFPNPSPHSATLTYDLDGSASGVLTVHTLEGRLLIRRKLDRAAGRLTVGEELRSGLYLITVTGEDRSPLTRKWLKY